MQRDYEAVFITAAELSAEEQNTLLDKLRGFIQRSNGEIITEYLWGRRKLAYAINKKQYGVYHIWYLRGDGDMLNELDRQFSYADSVIRSQTIHVEDAHKAAAKFEELTGTSSGSKPTEGESEQDEEVTETAEA
jgi:small subunit ribosomal protein S6